MSRKETTINRPVCGIRNIYKGQMVTDGAGVRINRIIGSRYLGHIDPFVLLDEIRSSDPEDYIAGFPTHPHRGIETITYMLHGRFRHKDSRGGGGLLTDGCVQWMTAGRGILHSEMPEAVEGEACGYQLWLSLAAKDKMVEPRYQHLSPEMMPVFQKEGLVVRVISGEYQGVKGPAQNWVPAHYFDCEVSKGEAFTFDLDGRMNSFCYVHSGTVRVCSGNNFQEVGSRNLIEFMNGSRVEIGAGKTGTRVLFLSALPNNEPIVRGGPFVMNTEEEIDQAFLDYRNGLLG
jgi:quercetin 2,3-dioxygenase